jgi:tRNA-specific 2-thiouridylase
MKVARRPESQEACFLGGGDYRAFLERHGLPAREGPVVDEEGATVGTHQGFWRFTPGQRRGLGVAVGRPTYAVRSDPRTNTVVVGPREALACRSVAADGQLFTSVARGDAKLRYRSPALPADVEATADGFRLRFDEPAYGVANGQTAVVYEGDVVVGAGTIASSAR